MISEKEQILEAVKTLPENTTWDDALYTLYMYSKLQKSKDDIKHGRVMKLEEVDKEMEALYERYSIKRSQARHK